MYCTGRWRQAKCKPTDGIQAEKTNVTGVIVYMRVEQRKIPPIGREIEPTRRTNPSSLARYIIHKNITVVKTVPTTSCDFDTWIGTCSPGMPIFLAWPPMFLRADKMRGVVADFPGTRDARAILRPPRTTNDDSIFSRTLPWALLPECCPHSEQRRLRSKTESR